MNVKQAANVKKSDDKGETGKYPQKILIIKNFAA